MPSGFTFGAPPNASVGGAGPTFGFGTASTGSTFGTPAPQAGASSSLPAFGAPAATSASTGFSFGGLNTNTVAPTLGGMQQSTGLSFNPPGAAATAFNTSAAPSGGFNFGAQTTSTPSAPAVNFSLGSNVAPTSSTTGFNFSAPAATSTPSFGLGSAASAPLTTESSSFGTLGAAATSSTGFGLSTTSAPTLGGLGTSKPSLTLGASSTATSTPFIGLGGVDTNLTSLSAGGTHLAQSSEANIEKASKENNIHEMTLTEFKEFTEFVKQQRSLTSELSRSSIKPMHKVQDDIRALSNQLDTIQKQLVTLATSVKVLRGDASASLQQADMAQQTYDTPPGFQLEYFAPDEYFANLTIHIEQQIAVYRAEVASMEKMIQQVSDSSTLTADDLKLGVRHIHNIFVALASKLQGIHLKTEKLKEMCLVLRRLILNDTTDVFEQASRLHSKSSSYKAAAVPKCISGPPLFTSSGGSIPSTSLGFPQQSTLGAVPTFASSFGGLGQSSSMMGGNLGAMLPSSGQPIENRSFQLQQPPVGHKRNKR